MRLPRLLPACSQAISTLSESQLAGEQSNRLVNWCSLRDLIGLPRRVNRFGCVPTSFGSGGWLGATGRSSAWKSARFGSEWPLVQIQPSRLHIRHCNLIGFAPCGWVLFRSRFRSSRITVDRNKLRNCRDWCARLWAPARGKGLGVNAVACRPEDPSVCSWKNRCAVFPRGYLPMDCPACGRRRLEYGTNDEGGVIYVECEKCGANSDDETFPDIAQSEGRWSDGNRLGEGA